MTRTLFIDGEATAAALKRLREEFPTVAIRRGAGDALWIDAATWCDPALDFFGLDARVRAALDGARALGVRAAELAVEVLTRYQSTFNRRNAASSGPEFDAVLALHRELHDLTKPLVHADFLHARDTWQWVLRLEPSASLEVQLAALFHDIERLTTEAEVRVEQHARDYQAFKDAHARAGAEWVAALMARLGLGHGVIERVRMLVSRHERPDGDGELALVNDADALSFFSLNAHGYLNYFGVEQTAKKVEYTLRRLRPRHHARLAELRLPAAVRAMLDAARAPSVREALA